MQAITARDVMTARVFSVNPDLTLMDLERELASHRISGAPVVERGKVVGIVSRSDIDQKLSRERSASAATATFYWQADVPDDTGQQAPPDPTSVALERLQKTLVRQIMTPQVISVSPDTGIRDVARVMHERRVHRVLVLEDGCLVGLISSLDLVGVLAKQPGR